MKFLRQEYDKHFGAVSERQRARYVQAVEGTDTEFWAVAASEVGAEIESVFGHRKHYPASGALVIFHSRMHSLRFRK